MDVRSYQWSGRELAETSCLWTVVIDMTSQHLKKKTTFN